MAGKEVNGMCPLIGRENPSGAASCDSLGNGIPGIRGEACGNGIAGPPGIGEGGLEREIGCPSRTWPGGYVPPKGVVERGRGFEGAEEKMEPGYPEGPVGRYGISPGRMLGDPRMGLGEAARMFGEAARMFGEAARMFGEPLILEGGAPPDAALIVLL
jgi:hypothetical protein